MPQTQREQVIQIHRLMRAVKIAHTDMDNASGQGAAIIGWVGGFGRSVTFARSITLSDAPAAN